MGDMQNNQLAIKDFEKPKVKPRGPGRRFQKGEINNPRGRPKEYQDVKAAARAHTVEAIERLAFWMRSDDGRASVMAANSLLDRGWGKPSQDMNLNVRHVIEEMTDDELRAIAARGRERPAIEGSCEDVTDDVVPDGGVRAGDAS